MFVLFVSMQANACTYTDHAYKDTHIHTHTCTYTHKSGGSYNEPSTGNLSDVLNSGW